MKSSSLSPRIASLPKVELHLHLEGSIRPAIARALSARHGVALSEDEVRHRYDYSNFTEFIEAFKWVTSFLREPRDFALLAADLAEQLLEQHVVYAEVTLSVGIMLLRKQDPQANFEAILAATEPFEKRGLRLNWVFDAVRQFGPEPALEVVEAARRCASPRIVAFGIGGDELSVPTREFRYAYLRARSSGLHRLIHAGEIGGPEKIREAIEILGVERIGHGIAAIHDPALMDLLAERRIPLEVCPTSNLRTGSLALQLHNPQATLVQHPLPRLIRHAIPVVLSTDDPAMFHASLLGEYEIVAQMGLSEAELVLLHRNAAEHSFLSDEARRAHLATLPRK
ncbi:MAG TPA: adenosine deaminase [Verrucomicrobiae bacterium]|nr:adenosine deaminase [Verrucomicrobiae bacterium]